MLCSKPVTRRIAVATAAPLVALAMTVAPAQADPVDDAFLRALDSANIAMTNPAMTNPADAVALGQSVCPMLAQPGQNAADAAASVADAAGMPLGPATMFTGLAISAFCPGAMAAFASGQSPLPFDLLPF